MKNHTKFFFFTTLVTRQLPCFIINKINGYNEESNGFKYLTLVPADESKNTLKKYEEL